jgi:addiction module HigA family antidote
MTAKQGILEPIHPGEILFEEFMKPMVSVSTDSPATSPYPPGRISAIVNGKRAITADTAMRLGRYFGTSPEVWMGLQTDYELRVSQRTIGPEIEKRVRIERSHRPMSEQKD